MKKYHALLLLATFCFLFCAANARADEGDPPTVAGRLSQATGTVSIQPSGINQWSAAGVNYPIATGDRFYADQDGRAELEFGNAVARIWNNTDLTVTTLADNQLQLGISQGDLHLRTQQIASTDLIEVDTPNGALTVVRPGDIRITIYPGDGGTGIAVYSGEITVSGPGLSEDVRAGQSIQLAGTNPISATLNAIGGPDDFDQWSSEEDQRWLDSRNGAYVNSEVPGYEDLGANGQWSADANYGTVWYPAGVAADWAPYRYGHWVWSGPWGWTWVEDEPWGYAPFHYGRWVNLRGRWGWLPGPIFVRPVWSPALVAFVGGNGFSVGVGIGGVGLSAWFPLGPGEPYYPWYHCSPHYVDRVNIANIRSSRAVVVQKSYYSSDTSNVHYSYRTTGVTAVRSDNFANGKSVRQNIVNVDHNTLEHAQLIPHPEVAPTARSLAPRPVNNLRVSNQRPTLLTRGGQQMQAVPGARPQPVPSSPRPPQNTSRSVVVPMNRAQPSQSTGLVYRNEPRVAQPSFDRQQPALNQHPGRPLEPQQVDNIRQGRPAGPQRDVESIPHAQPQPRSAPASRPSSHSAPPATQSKSSGHAKDDHHN
jgi:hypothetical protein